MLLAIERNIHAEKKSNENINQLQIEVKDMEGEIAMLKKN
jgi:hypothetical protein